MSVRRHALISALLVFGLLPATAAAASDSQARVLALPVAPGVTWEGQQYPAADSQGRFRLLRTRTLEVYPVERDRSLGEPEKLRAAQIDSPAPVLDARMDRHGDWVLLDGMEVRWFPAGKEKSLPSLDWIPSAVGLRQGRPVATVMPLPVGRGSQSRPRGVPFLMAAETDDWSTLIESDLDSPAKGRSMAPVHNHDGHLFVADDGETCFAHLYRYHFECFTPGGRKTLDVTVDGGKVAHVLEDDEGLEAERVRLEEERARMSEPERVRVVANTGVKVILDLTQGIDGLYLLVENPEGEGLVLDRYTAATQKLERVAVAGAVAKGAMNMVAGKDGLLLAAFNGSSGRWLVPWDALAEAEWEPVEGVKVGGQAPVAAAR